MLSKFTAVGSSPAKYGCIKTSLAHNGLLTFFFLTGRKTVVADSVLRLSQNEGGMLS